jgi:copper chaperone
VDVIEKKGGLTSGEAVHSIIAAQGKGGKAPGGSDQEKEKGMTTIQIKGMSCRHCVMAVTKALSGIDGIKDVQVDLEKGEATFTEEKTIDRALIRERIVKAGFDVAG